MTEKEINQLRGKFDNQLETASTLDEVENLNLSYLGRKGKINFLLGNINNVPARKKRKLGSLINDLKQHIEKEIEAKRTDLLKSRAREEWLDVTLPGKKRKGGSLHPTTYAIEEIVSIFKRLGFIRISYPEVEWEYFAFDSLNMPENHPARDDFETFFLDQDQHSEYGKMVLTPHTSSGQVREMKRVKNPPIRMINIAKCYRPNWDVTHTPMFYQFEGLCVDKGITITDLKGTIEFFAKHYFGKDRSIRLRPFHFQFTEPSFEVDVICDVCKGRGKIENHQCRVCKSGWLELGGAGMVHPFVLNQGGINPEIYTGWAFGIGIERVFMMKEGLNVDDLRIFYSGDLNFLKQF